MCVPLFQRNLQHCHKDNAFVLLLASSRTPKGFYAHQYHLPSTKIHSNTPRTYSTETNFTRQSAGGSLHKYSLSPVQTPTSRRNRQRCPKILWLNSPSFRELTWYTATHALSAARSMGLTSPAVASSPKTQFVYPVPMNSASNASQPGFRPRKVRTPALFADTSSSPLRQQSRRCPYPHAATAR